MCCLSLIHVSSKYDFASFIRTLKLNNVVYFQNSMTTRDNLNQFISIIIFSFPFYLSYKVLVKKNSMYISLRF